MRSRPVFSHSLVCSVHHRTNRRYQYRYKKLEKLSQELLYQRAVAKKYNPANTTFKGGKGADARKFARAQQQLRATQDRIDDEQLRLKVRQAKARQGRRQHRHLDRSSPTTPLPWQTKPQELAGDLIKMERLCAGALVIFEHRRSRDRALRDYELYSNHLLPFVQPPPPLLFRGRHRLVVTEAPPPSDVVFENWEGSALSRLGRRVLTNLVTLVLLCMALFVVVSLRAVSNNVAAGANFDGDFCGALGDQVYQVSQAVCLPVFPCWPHPFIRASSHTKQTNKQTNNTTGHRPGPRGAGPLVPLPAQQPRGRRGLPRRPALPLLLPPRPSRPRPRGPGRLPRPVLRPP